ncbi:MAG TPA: hypothetical protein VGC47_04725 [Acidimicrobiia bacterium]|jgi:hypothetical protein
MNDWEHAMVDSLRSDLLSIEGIASAELDGDDESPAGVKVRLTAGADAQVVGREVRRVLARHGMTSQMPAADEFAAGPPPPPGAPVLLLPSVQTTTSDREGVTVDLRSEGVAVDRPDDDESEHDGAESGLASIAVEEGRNGVTVRVNGNGRIASRRARASGTGLDEAIVSAVGEILVESSTPPLLVKALSETIEGTQIVTVLVEVGDGARRAGSAVLEGGRAYAVARAVWVALSERV